MLVTEGKGRETALTHKQLARIHGFHQVGRSPKGLENANGRICREGNLPGNVSSLVRILKGFLEGIPVVGPSGGIRGKAQGVGEREGHSGFGVSELNLV